MRIGKLGVYSLASNAPLPENSNFDTLFRLAGSDDVYGKKVTGAVYRVGADPLPPTPAINTGKKVYVDSVFGNDLTGRRQRQDLPFATILVAQAVALQGDQIVVLPGNYTDENIGSDGLNYHFEDGAIVTSNGNNFYEINSSSFVVTGYGRFISNFGANVVSYGANNKLYIEGLSMLTNSNYNLRSTGGSKDVSINMSGYMTMNGTEQCFRVDGSERVFINTNVLTGKGGILQNDGNSDSEVYIRANKIYYNPLNKGYVGLYSSNGRVEIHGDLYTDEIGLYGSPVFWIDNSNSDLHSFNFYGNIYSTCADDLMWITAANGVANFYGQINKVSSIITSSGVLNIRNDVFGNQIGKEVVTHNGGKTIIHSLINNLDVSAGSHGIVVAATGLVLLQGSSIVTNNNNVDSVNSIAPQSIKVYPRPVATKAVNVNITELISSILVDVNTDSQI